MPFTYEKKENGEEVFAELTGHTGTMPVLMIPDEIDGIPVRSIAPNAFSWRDDIKEAILPERLRTLRGFAFYNAPNLKRITLHDGIEDYYDGVIRHCKNLSEIRVFIRQDNYGLIKSMLGDNDRFLRLTLFKKEETVCLTFPEYFSDYIEDTRARAFHTKIEGAGYRYRECVTRQGIRYQEYDEIFIRASSYDGPAAAYIALDRLRYPYELSDEARERYEAYLYKEMGQILPMLIEKQEEDAIGYLAKSQLIPADALEQGLKIASKSGLVAVCARLMEAQKQIRKPEVTFVL